MVGGTEEKENDDDGNRAGARRATAVAYAGSAAADAGTRRTQRVGTMLSVFRLSLPQMFNV